MIDISEHVMKALRPEHLAAAEQFVSDPSRVPMPPAALDVMTALLIDRWKIGEYEEEIGAPARSAKALLAQALDTYIAISTWALIRGGQPKPKLPDEVEELRAQIDYLTAADAPIDEISAVMQAYGLTKTQAKIVIILRRAGGAPVSDSTMGARLYADDPNDEPEYNAVAQHVCIIRRRLGQAKAPFWIERVHGCGYRAVSVSSDDAEASAGC